MLRSYTGLHRQARASLRARHSVLAAKWGCMPERQRHVNRHDALYPFPEGGGFTAASINEFQELALPFDLLIDFLPQLESTGGRGRQNGKFGNAPYSSPILEKNWYCRYILTWFRVDTDPSQWSGGSHLRRSSMRSSLCRFKNVAKRPERELGCAHPLLVS